MTPLPSTAREGMALVITLGALVLVTVLVLAFFSRAQLNRQIAFSSTNLAKTDLLARSALDLVVGDLRDEIITNSTVTNSSGVTIYLPSSATNMLPAHPELSTPPARSSRCPPSLRTPYPYPAAMAARSPRCVGLVRAAPSLVPKPRCRHGVSSLAGTVPRFRPSPRPKIPPMAITSSVVLPIPFTIPPGSLMPMSPVIPRSPPPNRLPVPRPLRPI